MELTWNSAPVTDPGPFSKDVFDKFSLAPTIIELWANLQSPDVKPNVKEEGKTTPASPSSEIKQDKKNKISPQTNISNSYGESNSTEMLTDCNNDLAESKNQNDFPNPKVPYPCFSSLSRKDRVTYLFLIRNKLYRTGSPTLMVKAKTEVAEFMKYLQDVTRLCADDYKYMPPGAARYTEEYFQHCLDLMKNYPQIYTIAEITSLTGGKFVSDISLNFEKILLAMGSIQMTEKRMLPENTQLAVDYESVSAVIPPSKKANNSHTPISSDRNAEMLSATYEPHVCLAKEAFIQLLNSATFIEAWELPVCIKLNPAKGSSRSKTVYIDPPLLKTEMTFRERNHLIHEESVKLAYKTTSPRSVFFLASEDYSNKTDEKSSRAVVTFDDADIDFEVDVTDLESFGESSQPRKKENKSKSQDNVGLDKDTSLPAATEKASIQTDISLASSTPAKTDLEDSSVEESAHTTLNSLSEEDPSSNASTGGESSFREHPPAKRLKHSFLNISALGVDSDEERLIIDDTDSQLNSKSKKQTQEQSLSPDSIAHLNTSTLNEHSSDPNGITSPISPTKDAKKGTKRQRISKDCDQLGNILRMQDAMLKSTSKEQKLAKAPTSEVQSPEGKTSNHTLVKPSVSAYLDSKEGLHNETAVPNSSQPSTQKKRLLREDLLASVEDEQDYEAPQESNVLYKLYSLLDVLLMVRSTVAIAHPRCEKKAFRAVPVHVLPKLEYQLCYGAESLTHSEACQLWAEQLLHSSTVSFIGRINAHTSKLVQLQELQSDWIQNTSCDFKPARCLNTLHHILKKITSLQEGSYLLAHKPGEAFVTIFKTTDGKKPSRSVYDLQAVHCGPPVVPTMASVPWVPLDPHHLLPFHQKHCRPPCTFPPRPVPQSKHQAKGGPKAHPVNPSNASQNLPGGTPPVKKKKNKKKRKVNQSNQTQNQK
ncbi:little elongation complex subunit 2 [Trichomycterus rosablanca]|uniref:little elongation complex subunit 2 n=1 Tax=Trichomycterus rosablanca TaxID=2290929 RepID=UPI002F35F7EB